MTLVRLMNVTGTDKVYIVGERSFMYIMKRKGSKIDPWGTACLFFSSLNRNFGLH
jgi:hypothetical protein